METPPADILEFWYGADPAHPLQNQPRWWKKDPEFDRMVARKFEPTLQRAAQGELESWNQTPRDCLAYIILLDQFSRNIYRDTPAAFAQDERALAAGVQGQERGIDLQLTPVERWFFYMPMMHSENREMQRRSVETFRKLAEEAPEELKKTLTGGYQYAVQHAQIIERFGRFPHRNAILGRQSTPEELEFLRQPGSSF